jgi:hypothetical protein
MKIKVRLLSINRFDLAQDLDIDVNREILTELDEVLNDFSKELGVDCRLEVTKIKEKKLFEDWILRCMFPGYRVYDKQSVGGGVPDYELELDDNNENVLSDKDYKEVNEDCKESLEFNEKHNCNSPNKYEFSWAIRRKITKKIAEKLGDKIRKQLLDKYDKLAKEVHVEVKWNADGLRSNQINWMLDNKDKKEIFLLIIKEVENGHRGF